MCTIIRKTKRKEVAGYKIVYVADNGDIYSSFTGQKYKIGKPIDKAPNVCRKLDVEAGWNDKRFMKNWKLKTEFYDELFDGKTAIFKKLKDLKKLIGYKTKKATN